MSASLDHLWEFLYLRLQSEPERGWQLWSELFDQCREDWQIDLCRRLLREIKRTDSTSAPSLMILVLAHSAEWHTAERARLTAIGLTPPFVDGQIMAIAQANGLILVTLNPKDYAAFAGVKAEDWSR